MEFFSALREAQWDIFLQRRLHIGNNKKNNKRRGIIVAKKEPINLLSSSKEAWRVWILQTRLVGEEFCRKKSRQASFNDERRSIGFFFAKNIVDDEELKKYRKRKIKRKSIKVCKKVPVELFSTPRDVQWVFFLQRRLQMAITTREGKEEDEGEKWSREKPIEL